MIIRVLENTGYKYDPTYRFFGWEYADRIKPVKECGAENLKEFYLKCREAWNIETCSERFRPEWSAEQNRSIGQCTITSALVNELFGGEVYGIPLEGGGRHNFNRFDGHSIDLTSEQFGADTVLDFENAIHVDPATLLSDEDKQSRFNLLKKRLGV